MWVFENVSSDVSGIEFSNDLNYTESLNPYTYKNFFNGGGVGIGDINNDGLADIFFCGNMVSNKLYLNKESFKFEDITSSARLQTTGVWSTGVSIVDINGDGWNDIYVCKSGPPGGKKRFNELFINNQDNTFTESAADYGLDNEGLSSHATFFDYDRDGDLDCYLLNNSIKSIGGYDLIKDQRLLPDTLGGNKLLRNDDGYFSDVTLDAGIYSSDIGFGLGVTIGDINGNDWPDIYVSNDFFERDYLYINSGTGVFTEELENYISELSTGSMGADLADINNDGFSEIFVTEMLPENHDRLMSKAIFESWDKHQLMVERGYHNQFGRNVLQLNNGNKTFSEIGRYSGIEATDWSWGALIFDMDNDGLKDLFVANGIARDLLDLDYVNFVSDPQTVQSIMKESPEAIRTMIDMMPSEPLRNYFYQNNGDLTFMQVPTPSTPPGFSNGSAYGDLDNDGDLDLVINNINSVATLLRNDSDEVATNNYLSVSLEGIESNTMAIGAKVTLFIQGDRFFQELNPFRGFQSTVDSKLVFGLGEHLKIDSMNINWPNGQENWYYNLLANQALKIDQSKNSSANGSEDDKKSLLQSVEAHNHVHKESDYTDFDRDRLLFEMNSTEGPCLCVADVNLDGREDMFLGGSKGYSGSLHLQQEDGSFSVIESPFTRNSLSEDIGCLFFDANGDEYPDLYVASGSSEFTPLDLGLHDQLYLGSGSGFTNQAWKSTDLLQMSTGVVLNYDFNDDGHQDLFLGGRQRAGYYGVPTDSKILINDGNGVFEDQTNELAPELNKIGMITDATMIRMDATNLEEQLVVVGKWMSPKVFTKVKGQWKLKSGYPFEELQGLYNTVETFDLNGDGNEDLVFGNIGGNTRYHATKDEPLGLLVNDFDNNGKIDLVTTMYFKGENYPLVQLKDLVMQLPHLKKEFLKFGEYKNATVDQVFGDRINKGGYYLKANKLTSYVWLNDGHNGEIVDLPAEMQFQPIYDFEPYDVDGDGILDMFMGGNLRNVKPEMGSYMAGFGNTLIHDGQNGFGALSSQETGFFVEGEVRQIKAISLKGEPYLVVARNNDAIKFFRRKTETERP